MMMIVWFQGMVGVGRIDSGSSLWKLAGGEAREGGRDWIGTTKRATEGGETEHAWLGMMRLAWQ